MKHLSASEFVDHAEGRLSGARASHVDGCRAIAAAADADVPEPSPLFWQRFPERVHEAIRGQTPAALSWWRHPAFTIACTAILVVTVFAAIRSVRVRSTGIPSVAASAAPV